jgi:dihydrofolate reductase
MALPRARSAHRDAQRWDQTDGFITGPNVRVGNGMGDDGDRLHDWKFDARTETDDAIVEEMNASTGAVLIGKRMFNVGFEPWGDPPPFGMPVFIVTHEQREPLPMQGGTTYTFVTDGIEAALELTRAAAGDKNVGIWGGANIMRQYLKAGLLDEMQIHLIPYSSATASGSSRISTLGESNCGGQVRSRHRAPPTTDSKW